MESRTFQNDIPPVNILQTPGRFIKGFSIWLGVVCMGIFLLRFHSTDAAAALAAIVSLVLVGGGGIFFAIFMTIVANVRRISTLTVDTAGLTWTAGAPALAAFGFGVKTRTVPWPEITGLRVMQSKDLPAMRELEARRKASSFSSGRVKPLPSTRYVAVSVRSIEPILKSDSTVRTKVTRSFYNVLGSLEAGPVVGMSADELLHTLEAYRSADR